MRRAAAVLLLLTLVACTEAGPTPKAPKASEQEQVVETLMRAIEDGDCNTVKDVVLTPSEIDCDQIADSAGMQANEGVDLDKVRYTSGDVIDDSSTVKITWNKDLPTETIDVQRVNDTWLVVFDSDP